MSVIDVSVSKENYEDPAIVGCLPPAQRGVEFELSVSLSGCSVSGAVSREQLVLFREELGKLLRSRRRPRFGEGNRSDMRVSLVVDEHRSVQDR